MSYTADELWDALPKTSDRESSVFLSQWYDLPAIEKSEGDQAMDAEYWALIAQVKDAVNKVMESKRSDGVIGKSLTSVTLL